MPRYSRLQRWFIYDLQWRRNRKRQPGPPSPPPGELEFIVNELDGLDNYETTFVAQTGNIMVRLFARNNSDTKVTLKAYWNDVEMDAVTDWSHATDGSAVSAIFAIEGGAVGEHTLRIETVGGSCGCAAIRLAEAPADLPPGPQGDAGSYGSVRTFQAFTFGLKASTPSTLCFAVAGWVSDVAHPVTLSSDGTMSSVVNTTTQWTTWVDGGNGIGISACFAYGTTSAIDRTFFTAKARSSLPHYAGSVCEVKGLTLDME